jgi:hypothetical protein
MGGAGPCESVPGDTSRARCVGATRRRYEVRRRRLSGRPRHRNQRRAPQRQRRGCGARTRRRQRRARTRWWRRGRRSRGWCSRARAGWRRCGGRSGGGCGGAGTSRQRGRGPSRERHPSGRRCRRRSGGSRHRCESCAALLSAPLRPAIHGKLSLARPCASCSSRHRNFDDAMESSRPRGRRGRG